MDIRLEHTGDRGNMPIPIGNRTHFNTDCTLNPLITSSIATATPVQSVFFPRTRLVKTHDTRTLARCAHSGSLRSHANAMSKPIRF